MSNLTVENLAMLNPGDVVKLFPTPGHDDKPWSDIAVVNAIDLGNLSPTPLMNGLVIHFRRSDNSYFGFGRGMLDGHISFEILEEHDPVADYGLNGWDFVSNHNTH